MSEILYAGVGKAAIQFSEDIYPIETFCGQHDALHVRVMMLKAEIKIVIVSIEITSLREYERKKLKEIVLKMMDVEPQHIVICVTHTFSAPHLRSTQALKKNPELQRKNDAIRNAIETALVHACKSALHTYQEVILGYGLGFCNVNVNRDISTPFGYWLGKNAEGVSDKSVPIVQIKARNGTVLAYLYSYDAQPSIMDGVVLHDGGSLISADLYGASSSFIERQTNAVALYILGAAGDQVPKQKAKFQYVDSDGELKIKDEKEKGFEYIADLGKELGRCVLQTEIFTKQYIKGIQFYTSTLLCKGQERVEDMHALRPVTAYKFKEKEMRATSIQYICFEDIVIIALQPEISSCTAMHIRALSPFALTMIVTMVNGGDKYMPDRTAYDKITYEAMNSNFWKGSAERLENHILQDLHRLKEKKQGKRDR